LVTDEQGEFSATNVLPRDYKLTALPPDTFGDGGHTGIEEISLSAGQVLDGLRLVYEVRPESTIAGRVVTQKGAPIEGARIAAHRITFPNTDAGCQTDSDGRYTLYVLPEQRFGLAVSHPNFTGETRFFVPAGSRDVDFTLAGRGGIAGRVVDGRTGRPVTRFTVSSGNYSFSSAHDVSDAWKEEFNDEAGLFLVEDVRAGEHRLSVRSEGYAPLAIESVTVRPDQLNDSVVARMTGGATLRGRVVSMEGAPVPDAKLKLTRIKNFRLLPPLESRGSNTLAQRTDSDGRFELALLSPLFEEITVVHPDYPETTTPLLLTDGAVSSIEIVMTGLATVEGTVYLDGVPVAGQQVSAGLDGMKVPPSGETDAQGRFRIEGVPEGEVFVRVSVIVGRTLRYAVSRVVTQKGYTSTVDLEVSAGTASISGVLAWGEDSTERYPISISASEVGGDDRAGTVFFGGDGFQLTGLFGGTYTISAFETRGEPRFLGSKTVDVDPGATADVVLEVE
jgi:hypothetical protein